MWHMKSRFQRSFILIVTITVSVLVTIAVRPTAGQQAQATYKAPRLANGRPNLNGVWQAIGTANWDIQDHVPQPGLPEFGAIGATPPGQAVVEGNDIPYQAWALEKKQENYKNRWTADPEIKCYLPGVPRATYLPLPFQIIQSTNRIMMAYEFASASRVINMGKPTESPVDSWMGWSNGRWDGDALVVDVTGFNDQTWFDRAGNFHSEALHVIERYTPTSPDHLRYDVTIEDPKVFTRPWKMTMPLYRRKELNIELLEFKCVEFAEELLYGHLRKKTTN
jgi:hypothetical protein